MGTFYCDRILSIADPNIQTNSEGKCTNRNLLLHIQMYASQFDKYSCNRHIRDYDPYARGSKGFYIHRYDLTHITDDHFEIKLIARLLNQIYVIQSPILPLRHDDATPNELQYPQPSSSTGGARPSAPIFPEHLHLLLTHP